MLDAASEQRIQQLVDQMTLDERLSLIGGADAWRTHAVPRLNIGAIKVTDGPHGARGGRIGEVRAASFPCGTALGATWNPDLIRRVGAALGREARTKQAHVLLGPTLNLHRHPLAGRNFECYSEDPFLISRIGVAFILGVQSQGVGATAKHFVCNDSEFERMTISSEVGERALHEIYLPPFEAAVKEAAVWAAMSAYNRVNGTYASENAGLIALLKDTWGFDGLLMSDWYGTYSTDCAAAGLDLEMPGRARFHGRRLRAAIEAGAVQESVLEDKARRILRLGLRTGALDGPPEGEEEAVDRPEDRALILEAATEGMVLLKNDSVLPFAPAPGAVVALIGPHADELVLQGGGSSEVEPHHLTSLISGLRDRLGPGVTVASEPGCRISRRPQTLRRGITTSDGTPGVLVEYFEGATLDGAPAITRTMSRTEFRWIANSTPLPGQFSLRATATFTPEASGEHRFTLASAGLSRLLIDGDLTIDNWTSQEPGSSFYGAGSADVSAAVALEAGKPHRVVLEYQSSGGQGVFGVSLGCEFPEEPDLFERAVALARRADHVVVVGSLTAEWEAEGSDRRSFALPGRQDELIAAVLDANPAAVVVLNGGSPVAMPWVDKARAILQLWYPGQEGGDALAAVLLGTTEPGGRLPTTFAARVEDHPSHVTYPGEAGQVSYGEGVFVGYRAFERLGRAPLFPFGHGLGYTTFEVGSPRVDRERFSAGDSVVVRVPVRNTGSRDGSTVVQVYVRDVDSSLLRPQKELKGFAKLRLRAGEATEAVIELGPRAFEAWDPRAHDWVAEPGEFEVFAGQSSANIAGSARVTLV